MTRATLLASEKEYKWADSIYRKLVEADDVIHVITSVFPNLTGPDVDRGVAFIQLARGICRRDFFSRWNELCLMNRASVISALQQFAESSPQQQQLEAFIDLIEGGMSYELYQTIAKAKAALSLHEAVDFSFKVSKVNIDQRITRQEFVGWIARDLLKIAACVDHAMAKSGLRFADIDRVFLTGGSSFVPAVRQLFVERFGEERIETGEQLLSIAKGLALIGGSGNAERWAV